MTEVSEQRKKRECSINDNKENILLKEVKKLSSQEIANNTHIETKESTIEKYGECMSYDKIKELQSSNSIEHLKVISPEEYNEKFPQMSYGVLGHCDPEGNIYVKERNEADIKHITVHETMHLASENEVIHEQDGNLYTSGLRETRVKDGVVVSDLDQGTNEGTTEMYTLRELLGKGEEEAACSVSAYSESRMWMERMEGLVGEKKLAEAYFGGRKSELVSEFNRLNDNDELAWKEFSKDIDILEYGNDELECIKARTRIAIMYSEMINARYGVED